MRQSTFLMAGAPKAHQTVKKRVKIFIVSLDVASLRLFNRYYFSRCSNALITGYAKVQNFRQSYMQIQPADVLSC